jgi:predicted Zn-dependent protease
MHDSLLPVLSIGPEPPYLVHVDRALETKEKEGDSGSIIVPCITSNWNVTVNLFRKLPVSPELYFCQSTAKYR